jgi:DNA-binding beta-propeller fold protein YncE
VLICLLVAGAGSAAAATEFGEEGEHAGQFKGPFGVAVNQATGDVFLADRNNHRVDRFGGSGNWLLAWGWEVNAESPAEALQTCTTVCQRGLSGSGAGEFGVEGDPHGVAVDSELASLSYGDVYAVDFENFRVQKFKADGEFILTFGSGVLTAGASGTGTLTAPSSTC